MTINDLLNAGFKAVPRTSVPTYAIELHDGTLTVVLAGKRNPCLAFLRIESDINYDELNSRSLTGAEAIQLAIQISLAFGMPEAHGVNHPSNA